jgi:F-type H+-transporting ATPase subunit delta
VKLSIHDYAQALYEAVAEKPADRADIVHRFIDRLALDGQRHYLPQIMIELEKIQAEVENQSIVTVTTAEPLTANEKTDLTDQLKKQLNVDAITLREQVDPSLISGLTIQIGDQLIDHSVKSKLDNLAARL